MKSTLTAYKTGKGSFRHTEYLVHRVCKSGRTRMYRYTNENLPETMKKIMISTAWIENNGNAMIWKF